MECTHNKCFHIKSSSKEETTSKNQTFTTYSTKFSEADYGAYDWMSKWVNECDCVRDQERRLDLQGLKYDVCYTQSIQNVICINPWRMLSWFHSIWDNVASQSWQRRRDMFQFRGEQNKQKAFCRCCLNSAQKYGWHRETDVHRHKVDKETMKPCR